MSIEDFVARWRDTAAAERANKDSFLNELCDALGVERPDPTTGDPARDRYVFEFPVTTMHAGGKHSVCKVDLYREGRFLLEAKQGGGDGPRKGFAKRNTPAWNVEMDKARGQALGYVRSLDDPPPFLLVVDIGHCFDLYADFDGSRTYRPFPTAQQSRLYFDDLAKHADTLRAVWNDPLSLDPSRKAARVTREVAAHLAELARALEGSGHDPEVVARFLMRCIFTMFAEDVGLLPAQSFARGLEDHWIPNPRRFKPELEALWRAMNDGADVPFLGRLLKFNGGLFRDQQAIALPAAHLRLLHEAAACDWRDVEPAIFGTLLERALDPRERHRLGAHYTPRAYVERLVRPTLEEPLRAEWDAVRAEVQRLVAAGDDPDDDVKPKGKGKSLKAAPTAQVQAQRVKRAAAAVRAFHARLCAVRVLDPACGSGNFLYVSMEVMKRVESEVIAQLAALVPATEMLFLEGATVTPRQFLGVEKKPWAKEIAELVLWIGFLQWHARTRRNADGKVAWIEPVLQDLHNIECRDAVLAWDGEQPVLDEAGKPVTRWDGVTTKKHPVTGEDVPDESARVLLTTLVRPRRAAWPQADFIVGNPPFVGGWKLRQVLGDGYVAALRETHDDVPDACDLVMYWWNHAAKLVREDAARRFGLVTTTTISQVQGRRVTQPFLDEGGGLSLVFAVNDHPWSTDRYGSAGDNAEVRVAMTTLARGRVDGVLGRVVREHTNDRGELVVDVDESQRGRINADLRIGADVAGALPLRANDRVCSPGVKLHGAGFIVTPEEARALGLGTVPGLERHIRVYRNGKDLAATPRGVMVIDLFGLTDVEVQERFPRVYQRVLETVKPERDHNPREVRRKNWWLFGETVPLLRGALRGLRRYIATPETARRRYFVRLDESVLPDNAVVVIASDDPFHFGVLSSRIHAAWALAAGGGLGVRHEPRYSKTRCFDPFPFPEAAAAQRKRVADLAERLDAHRAARLAEHPSLTLNALYATLAKLRAGEALADKDKALHDQGLVSVLRQLHDELDAAVFDAYGWPATLTDEEILERVVALNAERAAEEARGVVRWLRPAFQNPQAAPRQATLEAGDDGADDDAPAAPSATAWPAKLAEQLAAVGAGVQRLGAATAAELAATFKGAGEAAVLDVLEALESVGRVVAFDDGGARRWKSVAATA
ncbi:MAG: type IIL restriction-modification enzyme MmeI [Polyangiales bacterium]